MCIPCWFGYSAENVTDINAINIIMPVAKIKKS